MLQEISRVEPIDNFQITVANVTLLAQWHWDPVSRKERLCLYCIWTWLTQQFDKAK